MAKRDYLSRHIAIIKRLQKSPATLEEIKECVLRDAKEQGNVPAFSKRNFQRDVADILSLHKINIEYSFSERVWKIVSDGEDELSMRILETFEMLNSLKLSNSLAQYIHFEKRKPHGTEHFYPLLQAIKNRLVIHLSYKKFWEDKISERMLEGYALKEFKGRWYLVAKDQNDGYIKTYGLDRIVSVELSRNKFTAGNFDVGAFFKYCFGIINPSHAKPQKITLAFTAEQGNYIKSFPLHESQKIVCDNADELRIELNLHPTFDFIMELLSHGEDVEVIAPAKLRKEIHQKYANALRLYGDL